jgi:uncharacterized protein
MLCRGQFANARSSSMGLLFPARDESLAVVLKVPGETCNINCHYCYEKRKPYPGSSYLEPATLTKFLEQVGNRPLSVMLHGGEPLLAGRARTGQLLDVLAGHSAPVSLSVQTNGILLDDRWLTFFEHRWPDIEIGVSLDGDFEGNAHRVDYRGKATYDRVVAGLRVLEQRGWNCGVIVVVSRKLLGRAEQLVEEMLRYPGVKNVKLSPCLDYDVVSKTHRGVTGTQINLLNAGSGMPGWATTPQEYAEFVEEVLAVWRRRGAYRSFLIEPFVSIIRAAAGHPTGFTHFDDRKDPFIVTLYPDGRIGSCDEMDMPAALLGHVDDGIPVDDLIAQGRERGVFSQMETLMAECDGCRVRSMCRGGSLPDRIRFKTAEQRLDYCQSRMKIIDSATELARR